MIRDLEDGVFQAVRDGFYFIAFPVPSDTKALTSTIYSFNRNMRYAQNGVIEMAKSNGKPKEAQVVPNDLKWVNYNMSEDEKSAHDAKQLSIGKLGELAFKTILQGYNLRVAYDAYSKCFQANLVPFQPENSNYGFAVSARGVTPERAVSLLLYKHYEIFEEQWAEWYKTPVASFEG